MGQKLHSSSARIANTLFDIGGVILAPDQPFVWSTGIMAPVYCDNRLMLSYPEARSQITEAFLDSVKGLEIDAVAGVATAGIAYAVLIADRLDLPMVYVRSKPKEYGRCNQIEGHLTRGSRVVIIEDLVSTGASSLHAAEAIRAVTGLDPLLVAAIVSYKLQGVDAKFAAANIPLHTLTDFDVLMQVGLEGRHIQAAHVERLRQWQQDPHAWSARYGGQHTDDN